MRQVLHLLIVDRARRAALAARHGSRWLLPVMTCGERTRAAPLVARWCAERGSASDVAGQWLGRVEGNVTDWLIAILARAGYAPDATLGWIPVDALSSTASVLDYQTWAVARSLDGGALPSVVGPFGNLDWPEDVRAWIAESAGSVPRAWTPYRVTAHEVVLGTETACGRFYFKGLTADRAPEAAVTRTLAALAPDSFARTARVQVRADGSVWWLTAECPGRSSRDTHLVAPALGRIQRATATERGSLGLPILDLGAASEWASQLAPDAASAAAIRRACATAMDASVPRAWVPMDLDPTNVLVDDQGAVRFIDVDDSFFGPAPLAMATFAQRSVGEPPYRAYERSWSPLLPAVDWPAFEIAAKVVEYWIGWNRLTRNIERGAIYAPMDLVGARIRDRLTRTIYRR